MPLWRRVQWICRSTSRDFSRQMKREGARSIARSQASSLINGPRLRPENAGETTEEDACTVLGIIVKRA